MPSEADTAKLTLVPPGPSASTVRLPGPVRTGGVASTVNDWVAAVLVFPAASVARDVEGVGAVGEGGGREGAVQAAVGVAGVSIEQVKPVAPAEVKVNEGVASLIVAGRRR